MGPGGGGGDEGMLLISICTGGGGLPSLPRAPSSHADPVRRTQHWPCLPGWALAADIGGRLGGVYGGGRTHGESWASAEYVVQE